MNPRVFARLVAPLARRVRIMVGRCVLEAVDDSKKMQTVKVQVLEGMVREDVEHFQPGGLSHVTPKDAEALFLAVGGSSDHGIAIMASDRTKRPTGMAEGETKVYSHHGSHIYFKSDGSVEIVPGDGEVHVGGASLSTFLARADKVDARMDSIETWASDVVSKFGSHEHDLGDGSTTAIKVEASAAMTPLLPLLSVACDKARGT